ncbi:MAG: hypothetical protein IKA99_04340 [Clostridia bacterium]|nr:hypothetical protein [Clostridia bacterium]
MSKYTTTIYYLKNNGFDFQLDEYPIFDENYRETLNNLILDNFLMDEIGFETPALFRHFLKTKMNEIMPYYNTLYKLQAEMVKNENLFSNVNLREEFDRNIEQTTESNGESTSTTNNSSTNNETSTSENKEVFQNTPQGNLKNQDINNFSYATNITMNGGNGSRNQTASSSNNGEITDKTTSSGSNLENYIKTITGNNGKMYNIELITKAINSFRNINTKLLSELEELFMGVY